MMVPMTQPPRHRMPSHRALRPRSSLLGLPRWAVVACLLGAGATLAVPVWSALSGQSGIVRAIDPTEAADPSAGPQPAAQGDPGLPATGGVAPPVQPLIAPAETVPADSGTGRRVVYSERRQRVWLVEDDQTVSATYLVSGSRYDNLGPGTYEVYSRSEAATSFDRESTMKYFVRFTKGPSGAAIGFHDIPVSISDAQPLQSVDELGLALSQGCIRQDREDALSMWDFAAIGTPVVVVR
jgi:L,D-transpeptidase catalytic domain